MRVLANDYNTLQNRQRIGVDHRGEAEGIGSKAEGFKGQVAAYKYHENVNIRRRAKYFNFKYYSAIGVWIRYFRALC
jgi:hypothetical protein